MNIFKKDKYKYLFNALIITLIGIFLLYLPSFLLSKYYVGGGDIKTQWYPFYIMNKRETYNAIKHLSLPFYSWNLFLGNNIYASKVTYGLFDIYNLIFYPFRTNYYLINNIQNIIKCLIATTTMYFYLIHNRSYKTSSLFSIAYGLSSFGLYFVSQPLFLSYFSFLPLYFLGIEKYLQDNKKYLFIIIVSLLFITNYYLLFATSILTPIYYLYRYYIINQNFKNVFIKTLKIIGYYFLSLMLVAILILPSFAYILNSFRIGAYKIPLFYEDIRLYLHLLISPLVPSHTYIYGQDVFNFTSHNYKEICLYAGSIVILLLPQYLKEDKKYFIATSCFLFINALFIFIPFLSTFLNGLSSPSFRFLNNILIFILFISSKYFDQVIDLKLLKKTTIIYIILIILSFVISYFIISKYHLTYLIQLITFIFIILLYLIIYYLFKKRYHKYLYILTIIELLIFSLQCGYKNINTAISKNDVIRSSNVIDKNISSYLDELDQEKDFYRTYVSYNNVYWSSSYNYNLLYNLKGTMTYDSTFAPSFIKMLDIRYYEIIDTLDWQFNIKDPQILNFINTKYAIVLNEDEIPFENYEIIIKDYRDAFMIVRNLDNNYFGQTYNKVITYDEFKNDYLLDAKLLNEYIICDKDIKEYLGNNNTYLKDISYSLNHLNAYYDSIDDSFMVIKIPYEKGWKIKIDDKEINYYECNGGMIGFPIIKGKHQIKMTFIAPLFKEGMIITSIGIIIFIFMIIKDKRNQ